MSRQLAVGILVGFATAMGLLTWAAKQPKAEPVAVPDAGGPSPFKELGGPSVERLRLKTDTLRFAQQPDGGAP